MNTPSDTILHDQIHTRPNGDSLPAVSIKVYVGCVGATRWNDPIITLITVKNPPSGNWLIYLEGQ